VILGLILNGVDVGFILSSVVDDFRELVGEIRFGVPVANLVMVVLFRPIADHVDVHVLLYTHIFMGHSDAVIDCSLL